MCYLSPIYKSELKDKIETENIQTGGDRWLKKLPDKEKYKVLGIDGLKAWKNGADWRNYMRNYSAKPAKSRFIDLDTNTLANTGNKKILITEKTIRNVKQFKYPNLTEEENKLLQKRQKELLTYAMKENNSDEVAFILSNNLKDYIAQTGNEKTIDFIDKAQHKLQTERKLYVLHNHPKGSSFSLNDIRLFVSNDNIQTMTLITNSGFIEALQKGKNYDIINMKKTLAFYIGKTIKEYEKNLIDENQFDAKMNVELPKVLKALTLKGIVIWKK